MVEDKKIKMKDQGLEYRKGFKWHTLSYSDIAQAYMRIEEVKGKMCCGVANFDMHFLMLKTGAGELIRAEASSREVVERALEELGQKNPGIKIGFER